MHDHRIPLWIKIAFTAYVCVLVPVYWAERGLQNFLWLSDIVLFTTAVALWLESRLLVSAMAMGALMPELGWNLDFFSHVFTGHGLFGLHATDYMFAPELALRFRLLSLFHIFLPVALVWGVLRLGYDRRAWWLQTGLTWLVLMLSYWVTDPERNINWVFGLGAAPQTWLPAPIYLAGLMLAIPLVFYLPAHLLFARIAPIPRLRDRAGHKF